MSLARRHREFILASSSTAVAPAQASGLATIGAMAANAAEAAQAQMQLRLHHDLRRLKEIQSIERKIEAKREMLPEYVSWVRGLLHAADETGQGVQDEILPTIMIWSIDTGDFHRALPLAEYVLKFGLALPARYERQPATLIVEEIAEAAIKAQLADKPFDILVLEGVEALTAEHDMPDEVRAKLCKAIGFELARFGEAKPADKARPTFERALAALRRAQELHDRVGAKDRIKRLEKLLKVAEPAPPVAPPAPKTEITPEPAPAAPATNTAGTAG